MTNNNKEAVTFDFESLTLAELLTTDFLTCSQCERTYTCPVLLPCLHTLCEDCVTQLTASHQNTEQGGQQRNNSRLSTEKTSRDPSHQSSQKSEQVDLQRTNTKKTSKDLSSQNSLQDAPQRTDVESTSKDLSNEISQKKQGYSVGINRDMTNKNQCHNLSQNREPTGLEINGTTNKDISHQPTKRTDVQRTSDETAKKDPNDNLSQKPKQAGLQRTNKGSHHDPLKRINSEETTINPDTSQISISTGKPEAKLTSANKNRSQKESITETDEQHLTKSNAQLGPVNKNGEKGSSTPRSNVQQNSEAKSITKSDGKLNSSNKNQKSSLMRSSSEKLNSVNVKEDKKLTSKTTVLKDNSTNGTDDLLSVRTSKTTARTDNDRHVLTATPNASPRIVSTSQSIQNTEALLEPINLDEHTTPVLTERSDLDLTSSSIDIGLLTFLNLNCDVCLDSPSNNDSNPRNAAIKTNGETIPSQTSGISVNAANKSNQNGVDLIRIQCPVCLAPMETNNESLKRVNMFVKHLCEIRSYKEDYGRTCEYCKYDGKTITATTLCLSCHDDLCDGCVKAHQRTRVTRDHQLAPYEQIQKGLYDHDIRNHQSILCCTHSKEVEFFCLTCAILLCKECKTDVHAEHKMKLVTKTFSKYKQQLESFLQGIKRRIPTVADYSEFLTTHSKQMITTREEIKESIDKQAKLLHQLIDEHKARLIDNLTTAFDQELVVIENKCKDLSVAEKSLTKNAEFLSHLLKFGKPEEVLIMHQPITNRLKQLVHMKPDSLKMRLSSTFKAGSATEQNIAIMFGNLSLERVPFNEEDSKQSSLIVASLLPTVLSPPELIQSFDMKGTTDSNDIWPTGLVVTESNYIIVDRDNKMVKIFHKNGQLEKQFGGENNNHLGSPFDATVLKNGNIAITDYKSEDVKIFDPSGHFIMSITGHFRYPRGITTNRNGDIVVVDCHRLQITTHNSDTGECISTISGTDAINKHLVDPYYIAVTDDDNFVVTDHAAPNIKIFNQSGECLAQYGTYGTYQGQVLQPYGVCVDRHGYIFVADHQNSRIHMLLPDGRFSKFLLTKREKLRNPVAVGVDANDHLIVAEALGKVKVWKYM